MAVGIAAQDAGIHEVFDKIEQVALVDRDVACQPGQGARTKSIEHLYNLAYVRAIQDGAGARFLSGLPTILFTLPHELVGVPFEVVLGVTEVTADELEDRVVAVVLAIEAHGAVEDAGLGGTAEDVVDGVVVDRVAGGLAMVVDHNDGSVVADGHLLQRGVDLRHLVGIHLVGAAVDTAEGVDDDQAVALGGDLLVQPRQAILTEGRPGEGEVKVGVR